MVYSKETGLFFVEVPLYFCQVLICRQYITAAILKHASHPILNFHAHHIECDRVSLRETTLKPLAPFLLLSPRLTIPHVKAKIQWYMCPYNLCTQKNQNAFSLTLCVHEHSIQPKYFNEILMPTLTFFKSLVIF